jgi:hypothetical protein
MYPITNGSSTWSYTSGIVVATLTYIIMGPFVFNSGFSSITWNTLAFDYSISGTSTYTFNSNVIVGGTLILNNPGSGTQTMTFNGAYKLYVGNPTGSIGNLQYQGGNSVYSGTMTIEFTGATGSGTWTGTPTGTVNMNININTSGILNLVAATSYLYGTGTITYTSGTVNAITSTLQIQSNCTLNTNGMSWANLQMSVASVTLTLTSNLTCAGNLAITGASCVLNGYTIYVGGNITVGSSQVLLSGTSNLSTTSTATGTWNCVANSFIYLPTVTINTSGIITITSSLQIGNNATNTTTTFTYIAGSVVFGQTSQFVISPSVAGTININSNGIIFNDVILTGDTAGTTTKIINLQSNMSMKGTLYFGTSGTQTIALNGTGYTLYVGSGSQLGSISSLWSGNSNIQGTATIEMSGSGGYGTISGTRTIYIINNFNINTGGVLTIQDTDNVSTPSQSGYLSFGSNTVQYIAGRVITKNNSGQLGGTLWFQGNCTVIGFHKLQFGKIQFLGNGITLTMNQFFSGIPKLYTTIGLYTSYTTNYNITFIDGFEKISRFIKISNCTPTKPLQLMILSPKANKGNNNGIRYINQSPNGISKKTTTNQSNQTGTDNIQMTGGHFYNTLLGLPSDSTRN